MVEESPELIRAAKPEKRSLLERYEIPVEHLSYEYISECTNSKILERIVLILRSGEEGVYPDLTKHAEKRLAVISPSSVVLRKAEPILKRCMLDASERNEIESDINEWMTQMKSREKDLTQGKNALLNDPYPQPGIRQTKEQLNSAKENLVNTTKSKRISSCDYDAWDKYDVDTEINKLDIREEQRCVESRNKQRKQKQLAEMRDSKDVMINKSSLTATELSIMAEQEKEKGNEAFRAGDYQDALEHYNLSINIDSNLPAYNNRAMTNIKLQHYEAALCDCNTVLSMEHSNIKALLRRALSLEHLEKKSQALTDYEMVLKLDPTHKAAIAGVQKLTKLRQSRKVRMVIEEMCSSGDEITTNSESDSQQFAKNNGLSLSKTEQRTPGGSICFCDRAPGPSQIAKPRPHFKAEYCLEPHEVDMGNFVQSIRASESKGSPRNISIAKSISNRTDSIAKPVKTKSIFSCKSGHESRGRSSVIIEELPAQCDNVNINPKNNSKNREGVNKRPVLEENGGGDGQIEYNINNNNKEEQIVDTQSKNRGGSAEKIQVQDKRENKSNNLENVDRKHVISSPYEFMRMWHSLKNDADYKSHANLLRSLNTDKLTSVFGSELDGVMFTRIAQCLERHFCTPQDTDLLSNLLTALSRTSRFAIVNMFMNADDKKALEKVFGYLEKQEVPNVPGLRALYRI